jgi:TusA-related sulfurtransferase
MQSFDLRDTIIPFSLLQIAYHFQRMKAGEEIEVIGNDPGIESDIKKILPSSEYRVVAVDKQKHNSPYFRLQLKKEVSSHAQSNRRRSIMSEVDLNRIETASMVDARGSACPGPLLEAKKGIGKVKVGEVLEIYSNDSGTRTDIPAWSKKVGHEYLGLIEADGYDKHFVRRNK